MLLSSAARISARTGESDTAPRSRAVATVTKAVASAIRGASDKAQATEAQLLDNYAKVCVYLDEIVQEACHPLSGLAHAVSDGN